MYYVVDYSICALAFLAVVMVRFFTTRQFPNKPNTLFGMALIFAALDIALDVAGALMHDNVLAYPIVLTHVVNGLFYFFQSIFPAMLAVYVLALTGQFRKQNAQYIALMLIPAAFVTVLLLMNPWTRAIFYVDPVLGYMHGPLFICLYLNTLFYAILAIVIINVKKWRLRRAQYFAITAFIVIVVCAVVLQFFMPRYLLTGPAIAIAMTMIYLVAQKPDDMLDTMTGAFDRGAMLVYLGDLIEDKKQYSVIHVRINNMHFVDRLMGTALGNDVLTAVAEYMITELNAGWVFRMGSVRFVVICKDPALHDGCVERIRRRFNSSWNVSGYRLMLSDSICSIPDTSGIESVGQLVGLIENLVPEVPRGEVLTVDEAVFARVRRHTEVENAILEALNSDGFEVYFQPVYSLREGCYVTAEALLRLHYGDGFISPDEFIPIAEQNGLIVQIDELVMRKVCDFFKKYDPAGTLGIRTVEINLSAVEFSYEGLSERITSLMEECGMKPEQVMFEITETAATAEFTVLSRSMAELMGRGFRFVLDDFGTGFANINQVVSLPFFAAKLDRAMLLACDENSERCIVYEASMSMFKGLGLRTVAEGVETQAQSDYAAGLGVDYIQGFLHSRPLPAEEFVEFMKARLKIEQ